MTSVYTIGVDASRSFSKKPTGTENYSYHIVKSIANSGCGSRFKFYVRPGQKNFVHVNTSAEIEIQVIRKKKFWTQLGLAYETWVSGLDLLFIPAHVVPFLKKPALPTVVTVHDLRTEFLPKHEDLLQRFYLNPFVEKLRAILAYHIIAVSNATKRDVVNLLKVPEDKITVIYEGVDLVRFNPDLKRQKNRIEELKRKYNIDQDYILFVGTIQPRKNLVRLIKAYARVINGLPGTELVLAGGSGWLSDEIYATPRSLGVENRVKFIGYVNDHDLPVLYAGAKLFAYPSLYEGFGLPILESLAVNTPVVTSNTSSMPEVGGSLVTYVDPESIDQIASGLKSNYGRKLSTDEINLHLKKFSWDRAGKETCALFKQILEYHGKD